MVRFEWNEKKNESNRSKHGIDFETARLVFEDPFTSHCFPTLLKVKNDGWL
jgi:uncharacterized DUF497 family protein